MPTLRSRRDDRAGARFNAPALIFLDNSPTGINRARILHFERETKR
jgi:hypothetical protein